MKTTAPAALRAAPSSRLSAGHARAADPVLVAALASAIVNAINEHRRRLGLAARSYAVRRAWTAGFLARILADPLALRVAQVVAALDGTGFALVVARLPEEPIPYAGCARRREPETDSAETGSPELAPVIRLPTSDCLCDAEDACARCA
jgi:hypothetical protein